MGQTASYLGQFFPAKPKFTAADVPDLTGKVVIVYLAARSKSKAEAAIQDLKAQTGKEALFLELDLSSLDSVKRSAQEFLSKEPALHILFNNAGVMWPPIDQLTADGYDLQWGTNVLGHFYFTELLMSALIAGAETSPDKKARVVTTSSFGNYMVKGIDFASFRDGPERKKLGPQDLYSQSKLGNVLIAREVAKRYGDKGIVSTSVNPGNIRTELTRHATFPGMKLLSVLVLYPVHYGAITQLYAGTSPQTVDANGKFFVPWAREAKPNPVALDSELGERLWKWCEEQVKDR
ncbi:NAD P-binding protein [Gloeophyllum trabeum ATCC 11539]|uniref:NAD P-binding protein n=1 Tax=Gloeophyllum trabeum (strain ATCC 11539 / FP-39264 / Madison 617) TaxID=670483 RepID=S7QDI6_GLOTA|nr:NAD P-binding protein [Gloeophyllum trabeum ATCC 11539]EPQ57453.1 NAD P-binding protein [Gloeophyllum trabeum ATCC 11539]